MNPLALMPTWTERAEHMEKVAARCEEQGNQRGADTARLDAKTFRLLAAERDEVSRPETGES